MRSKIRQIREIEKYKLLAIYYYFVFVDLLLLHLHFFFLNNSPLGHRRPIQFLHHSHSQSFGNR